MAEGAAPASGGKTAKPEDYAYPGGEKDQAIVTKVETAIASSPMGKFQAWLGDDGPVSKGDIQGKVKEGEKEIDKAKKDNPEEAKKAGTPPPVAGGANNVPAVKVPSAGDKGGPTEPKKGDGKGGKDKKADVKGKGGPAPGGGGGGKKGGGLAGMVAGLGDAEMSKVLNGYEPKNKETKDKLNRIKQMGDIAKGFDGQLDKFVGKGGFDSVLKGVGNFFGLKKDWNAVFGGENPYKKTEGTLGKIMRGLSSVKKVISMVGSICGKIGLVLTVVGLLGMIFPPIGAAVSGIARVLNVVGIICDALAFILSGVLTGLNGVVLAKQIAKGGSAEEKAASADLMMGEANDAAGSFVNLAMAFGPKFMKGFLGNSKGILGALMRRAKAFVGKIVGKVAGNMKNWAKKVMYKLGFGLKDGPGKFGALVGKVKDLPKNAIEKIKSTKLVKSINESKLMGKLESFGAKSSAFADKIDPTNMAEWAGKKVGGAGAGTDFAKKMGAAADVAEKANLGEAEKFAAADAANREREKIKREVAEKRKLADEKREMRGDAGSKKESKALKKEASKLDKDAGKMEKGAEKTATKAGDEKVSEMRNEAETKRYEDETKKKAIEEYKKDPKAFEKEASDLKAAKLEKESALKNASGDEKDKLERELKNIETRLEVKSETRMAVSGYEVPKDSAEVNETLKGGKEAIGKLAGVPGKPAEEEFDFKNPLAWNSEMANKDIENRYKNAGPEEEKGAEQHKAVDEVHNEVANAPTSTVASEVDSMLSGVGTETPKPEAPKEKAPPKEEKKTTEGASGGGAPNAGGGAPTGGGGDAGGGDGDKKDDGGDVGELAYWPALIEPGGGEFGKALTDIKHWRKIAIEFRKAQMESRKKAYETIDTYGKFKEYAAKKKELAAEHKGEIGATKGEANTAGTSAGAGEAKGGEGEGKQNEAKGNANQKAPEIPEPQSSGFWGRILARIKRWAAEKAAKVFGWIQEKIASVILQGLCNVSMGDLKQYSGALKNKMAHSKTTADKAEGKTDAVAEKTVKLDGDVNNAVKEAVDNANECDRNIADSDKFMQDCDETEQELAAEQANASTFLATLKAEAQAFKQQKEAEAKAKADKEANAANASDPGAGSGEMCTPDNPDGEAKPEEKKKDDKPEVSEADAGKIKAAAGFVKTRALQEGDQIKAAKEVESAKLKAAAANRNFLSKWDTFRVGSSVVSEFQKLTGKIAGDMGTVAGASIKTMEALNQQVGAIKEGAKSLDAGSAEAHASLNAAFKDAYNALNHWSRTGVKAMADKAGAPVEKGANAGLDAIGA